MLILLPPSETKREGGAHPPRPAAEIGVAEQSPLRRSLAEALVRISHDEPAARTALGLTEAQAGPWLERNRALAEAATMPALERYTGVLYDALDYPSLGAIARRRAARSVLIHSALFGLLPADEPIPSYRLSSSSKLPGMRLPALWSTPLAAQLAAREGLILDLRSEGYRALGPLPERHDAFTVHVVSEDGAGRRRALNHFNKHGKGLFVRRLLQEGAKIGGPASLLNWARERGIMLERGEPGQLVLVVESL